MDPRAWLADVLRRIAGHPASRLHELLPWAVDVEMLADDVAALAKAQARKPPTKRKQPT